VLTGTPSLANLNPVYLLLLLKWGVYLRSLGGFEIAFICATEGAAPIFWQIFKRCTGVNAVAWVAFSRVIDVVTDYATKLGHDVLLENLVVGQSGQNIQTILVQESILTSEDLRKRFYSPKKCLTQREKPQSLKNGLIPIVALCVSTSLR
jgi:hypothetical protein